VTAGSSLALESIRKRKYEAAREIAVALQAEVLSALPESEREKFLEQLGTVANAAQNLSSKSKVQ